MFSIRYHELRHLRAGAWLAAGLLTAPFRLDASVSRFLELATEIPLRGLGVGLDVAAGPQGQTYLSSESQGGIWRLQDGGSTWVPLVSGAPGPDVPRHPIGILADPQGRIWVADGDGGQVVVMDAQGRVKQLFGGGRQLPLRNRAALSQADLNQVAVWSTETRSLTLLSLQPEVLPRSQSFADASLCIVAGPATQVCIGEERNTLVAYEDGQVSGRITLGGRYARVGDLEPASGGKIYLTDTVGRRIYATTPNLGTATRFRLYESLLQTPTRLAVAEDRLWLVDEGRQSLLGFRIRDAESAWEHAILGEEYLALGLDQEAYDELQRAQALGLYHPDITLQIGIALYGLEQFEEALGRWGGLAAASQASGALDLWRGNALFRLGRYPEALDAYMSVKAGDPDYPRARFNLAQAHLSLGQFEPARALLEELVARRPEHAFARLSLARALMGLGDHRRAEDLLRETLARGQAAQLALYQLGHLYLVTGDTASALPLLEQAAEQGPYFRAALSDLIEAHQRVGNLQAVQGYRQRLHSLVGTAKALDPVILEDDR